MTQSCHADSLRVGEPLAGSAGQASELIALCWPKPRWHPSAKARSEGLPPELPDLEAEAKSAGRKLSIRLFQRRAQESGDRVELFAIRARHRELFRAELPLPELVARLRSWLGGDDASLEPSDERLLFVCTDGRHDRCCAEHGRPVLEALRASAPLDWTVLESSHIGGHRFAANCLALPTGHAYGRLSPTDVAPLVAALDEGRPYLPRYRGRWGASEAAQATEVWLHEQFPDAESVEAGAETREGDTLRVSARVHLERGDHDVMVSLVQRGFHVQSSCGEPAGDRVRWVPAELSG